jgi:hypothetical protein
MSNFTGQKIANTYKNLLQVNTSNSDLSTTLITVETGAGNATPLQLATDKVNINGTFQLGGVTLTANVSALNNIADLSGITGIVVGDSGSLSGRTLVGGSPITITNANGTAGNPTISLATTGITSATYGPLSKLNIDTYGRIINVSIATTISANSFIGGVFNGSSLTVENNTSIGGNVVIEGTTNMKAVSATDATLNNLTVGTKITAATVTATTIETSILRATKASVTELTADTLIFSDTSVSSLNATNLFAVSANATRLFKDGEDVATSATVAALSATMATSIANSNANITTNINAITSINTVVANVSGLTQTNLDAITSINTVVDNLSTTFAASIDNSNTNITANTNAITSINTVVTSVNNLAVAVSALTKTNLDAITSINTVVAGVSALTKTNLDAVTSINTVIDNLSATMATSIDNRTQAITSVNSVIANLSSTMATSIANHLPLAGGTMTGNLILNGSPSTNLQAATKQYVDNLTAAAIHFHDAVRVESPDSAGNLNATYDNGTSGVGATLTNAGTQAALVIDGITLNTSDRVLIYNQTNAYENGVYTVTDTGSASTNWVLTRATDADSYEPNDNTGLDGGSYFYIEEGDTGAGEAYVCSNVGTITFGTTDITFVLFSSALVYSAGTGINITGGRVISVSGVPSSAAIATLSATMATSINNTNTNVTTNINAITSINTVITDLSATMATSINNTNTNVTTNINAITSINTVITDLSATMATSIDNRTAAITSINTVITDLSATMATSINNANGVAVAFAIALG